MTRGGDGAEAEADDDDPRASRAIGNWGGELAATEAAAECRDNRAWSIVKRVCIRAVRRWNKSQYNVPSKKEWHGIQGHTSSSAFLAPRIASSKSRSPSPDFLNDSKIELSDEGGAGYHGSVMSTAGNED